MGEAEPIRVVVVDDHTVVREGLATMLEVYPDLTLVGEAADGERAVQVCQATRPDVVLMDLLMPRMDGVAATRAILQACPEVHILALTSFVENEMVRQALEAGAVGYLLKDISAAELAAAIRAARSGAPTLAPEAARILIQTATAPPALGHDLTTREREILGCLVEGLSNAQIARRLSIRPSTVKNHMSSIMNKLGASSRTEAATLAMRNKLT
jgi:NarL family two-component system response regulator LiaR